MYININQLTKAELDAIEYIGSQRKTDVDESGGNGCHADRDR